jgi:hypothetical protein
MKLRHIIQLAVLVALATIVLSGCQQILGSLGLRDPITPSERLEQFEETLNGDRTLIGNHLHEDVSTTWKAAVAWNTLFPTEIDSESVTYTIAGTGLSCSADTSTDGIDSICTTTVDASPSTVEIDEAKLTFGMTSDANKNDDSFIMKLTISESVVTGTDAELTLFDGTRE